MGKTLATFRIDESLWGEFKQLMDEEGTNASAELVKFVSTRLGKLDNLETVNTNTLDSHIDTYLDKVLDSHLDKYLYNFLTKDEAVTMNQLDHRAASIIERIESLEKKLEEFDKGFQSWGHTVCEHDQILHDKILSKSIATKADLQKAIASLKTEIEDLRKSQTDEDDDEDDDEDEESSQGLTKASLDPIFEPFTIPPKDALTQMGLAEHFGVSDSTVKRALDKGDEYFKRWTSENDPQGKSWRCVGKFNNPKIQRMSKYFVPC